MTKRSPSVRSEPSSFQRDRCLKMSDDEDEGPRSTFETYLAEGEKLSSKGYHAKALESISLVEKDRKHRLRVDAIRC